jgi:cytochrome c oxidase subunit 2
VLQTFMLQASSYAADIDFLVDLIGWMVGVWFFLCIGVFFYLIFKFRAKDGVKAEYITGEEKSQKRFISIPHALVLVCDVFIVFFAVRVWIDVKQDIPTPDANVRIIAQQWAWTFEHPGPDGKIRTEDDIRMVDELHVEVGKTYQYELESLDVLHDFSVPVWRLKQDAIPGRVITGWFQPTIAGEFDVQCAEMCGIGHGLMPARVFVETPEEHARWVAEQDEARLALAPAANPTAHLAANLAAE